MCAFLEKLGFIRTRQNGSHVFYKHIDGRTTVVPTKTKDLPRGTIRSILSDIGMTIELYNKHN